MGLRRPGQLRKIGESLTKVSDETAQQLGQSVGLGATTSPLQGAMVGATPDQAKMLGSQMNLRSAIRARATQASDDITTARRQETYTRQISQEEKARSEEFKSYFKNISGFAKLDEELAKAVERTLLPGKEVDQQRVAFDFDAYSTSLAGTPNQIEFVTALGDVARRQPGSNEPTILEKALNGDVNLTEEEKTKLQEAFDKTGLTFQEIKDKYLEDPQTTLAKQIADSKAKDIRLGNLDNDTLQKLGFDDDYLRLIFGSVENAKAATYADLKQRVSNLQSGFADVKELQRLMSDVAQSPTTRMEARKRLRELGMLGIRAEAEKVNDLQAQIEDGDVVRIGDMAFSIEEVLEDDDFQIVIAQALQDKTIMKSIEKNQPDLHKWITSNQQALTNRFQTVTGRLAPGQTLADLFVSEDRERELDDMFGVYDPSVIKEAQDILGISSGISLSASQKEQTIAQAKIISDNRTEKLSGLEEAYGNVLPNVIAKAFPGMTAAQLSVEQLDTLRPQLQEAQDSFDFESSGYTEQVAELRDLYKKLGKPFDEQEYMFATPSAWAASKPDLTNKLNEARQQVQQKEVTDFNDGIRKQWAGLSDAAFKFLYPAPNPETGKYDQPTFPADEFVSAFLQRAGALNLKGMDKTTAMTLINEFAGKSNPKGEPILNDLLAQYQKGNGMVDVSLLKSHYRAQQIAFPDEQTYKNFTPEKAFQLLRFKDANGQDVHFTPDMLQYLQSKSFVGYRTETRPGPYGSQQVVYVPFSKLPVMIDRDRDGKIDDVNSIANNIKADMLNPNRNAGSTLQDLANTGKTIAEVIGKDKDWVAATEESKRKVDKAKEDLAMPDGYGTLFPAAKADLKGPDNHFISESTKAFIDGLPEPSPIWWAGLTTQQKSYYLAQGAKARQLVQDDIAKGRQAELNAKEKARLDKIKADEAAKKKQEQEWFDYNVKKSPYNIPYIKSGSTGRGGGFGASSTATKSVLMTKAEYDSYMARWNKADSKERQRMSNESNRGTMRNG